MERKKFSSKFEDSVEFIGYENFKMRLVVNPPYLVEEFRSLLERVVRPVSEQWLAAKTHLKDATLENICFFRTMTFPDNLKEFYMEFYCWDLDLLNTLLPAVLQDVD